MIANLARALRDAEGRRSRPRRVHPRRRRDVLRRRRHRLDAPRRRAHRGRQRSRRARARAHAAATSTNCRSSRSRSCTARRWAAARGSSRRATSPSPSKEPKFRFSRSPLGPHARPPSRPTLSRRSAPAWRRALFATAESFDGDYAEKIGLVQYTVEDDAGLTAMMEHLSVWHLRARRVRRQGAGAICDRESDCVRVRRRTYDRRQPDAGNRAAHCQTARFVGRREGLAAFLEKRKPEWNS